MRSVLRFAVAHWSRILAVLLLAVAGWLYYEQHRPHPNSVITVYRGKTPPTMKLLQIETPPSVSQGVFVDLGDG